MEELRSNISALRPGSKILFLLFCCILAWLLSTVILWASIPLFFDMGIAHIPYYLAHPEEADSNSFLLYMQGGSSLGLFVGGALIYRYFAENGRSLWFSFRAQSLRYTLIIIFIGVIALFGLLPMVDALERFNSALEFPAFLHGFEQSMRAQQAKMEDLIMQLTQFESIPQVVWVGFVMAVIPAVGEEWIFRGKLQGLLQQFTNNSHLGVWLTAIIFTLIHQQLFAFLPMFLLALFLGYLYAYTRSLWLTIAVHFTNNLTSLIIISLAGGEMDSIDPLPYWMYFASGFLLLGAIVLLIFQWKNLGIHKQ
jgi:membrane protease YdiL (CAAX protease family)